MGQGKRHESAELLSIMLFGFLLRLYVGRQSLTENGLLPVGFDEYYHLRRILYTVNHFPNTLWFDSYLNYPHGLELTWPPLFDQLLAAISLMLGQHSREGVEMVSAILPAVMGALTIAVVYYLSRELFDRNIALLSALMVAIAPWHITRTMLGATDHHCLEILLDVAALLFVVLALYRKERRHLFAAVAGVTFAALAYTWLGADIYLGIFLVYAAVQMTLDLKHGEASTETTTTLLAAFGVAIILMLPFASAVWLKPSFLGSIFFFIGILLLYALARFMNERGIHWVAFPLTMLASACVLVVTAMLPGQPFKMYSFMQSGADYIFGGRMIGKIAEAEPLVYDANTLYNLMTSPLGLSILLSLAGLVALILYIRRAPSGARPAQLLFLVWTVAILILTFAQIRFLYLYSIVIGMLVGFLFFAANDAISKKMAKNKTSVEGQRLLVALAAVFLVVIIAPSALQTAVLSNYEKPSVAGDWYDSLQWLIQNSNTTSHYDNPVKAPEYGVMCWWDYGNWIVYLSHRPVVANNFQAGAEDSAKFYLSESEDAATAILDSRRARFVLIDYDTVFGSLDSLAKWANMSVSRYVKLDESESTPKATLLPPMFNTTMARLYLSDGVGTDHFRLVYESAQALGSNPSRADVKIFEYVPGALIMVRASPDQRVVAMLNMTSNQGRSFTYANRGQIKDGEFAIRVPYSTEPMHATHAIEPYTIFCGNSEGVKTQKINVSEKDILEGKKIMVNF
ncbi:MAG: oligosaccharyl transferase, archaeosortase A system-associated [Methanothrix sp.]|nr:oligosaccharyl transferase, archaeosortase A system-associated [Methanothrix sp.]